MKNKIGVLLSQIFMRLFGHATFISDKTYNKILYWLRNGKKADLDHPKTFNEHVMAIKVSGKEEWLTKYTDKLLVREYVENTIGRQYLVPLISAWDKAENIDFSTLPSQYILKTNHGSGWNYIVKDSHKIQKDKIVKYFQKALRSNYYYKSREKNYKNIKPQVFCEQLITPKNEKGIIDAKFFCFSGKVGFYNITYQDSQGCHHGIFEANGKEIPIKSQNLKVEDPFLSGEWRVKLITLAEKLAVPFAFVRVDFYVADEEIYFSELTFHSGGGIRPIEPPEVDNKLGDFFQR